MKLNILLLGVLFAVGCSKPSPQTVTTEALSVPTESSSASSFSFGDAVVQKSSIADKTFTFSRASGSSEAAASNVSISGSSAISVVSSSGCNRQLVKPADKCYVKVRLNTSALGSYTAELRVGDDQNYNSISLSAVVISGINSFSVLENGVITFSTVDFGTQGPNVKITKVLEIRKNGPSTETVTPDAAYDPFFSLTYNGCVKALGPNQSCHVRVTFNSGSPAPVFEELRQSYLLLNGVDSGVRLVGIRQAAAPPAPPEIKFYENSLEITTLDFGSVLTQGSSANKVVTIKNLGPADTSSGATLSGDSNFSVLSNNCPNVLGKNKSCQVRVKFAYASGNGAKSATLSMNGTQNLALTGTVGAGGGGPLVQPPMVAINWSPLSVLRDFGFAQGFNFFTGQPKPVQSIVQIDVKKMFNRIFTLTYYTNDPLVGSVDSMYFNSGASVGSSTFYLDMLAAGKTIKTERLFDAFGSMDYTNVSEHQIYFSGRILAFEEFNVIGNPLRLFLMDENLIATEFPLTYPGGSCILDFLVSDSSSKINASAYFKKKNNVAYFVHRCTGNDSSYLSSFDGNVVTTRQIDPETAGKSAFITQYHITDDGTIYLMQTDTAQSSGPYAAIHSVYLKKIDPSGVVSLLHTSTGMSGNAAESAYGKQMEIVGDNLYFIGYNVGPGTQLLRMNLSTENITDFHTGVFLSNVSFFSGTDLPFVTFVRNPNDSLGFLITKNSPATFGGSMYLNNQNDTLTAISWNEMGAKEVQFWNDKYVSGITDGFLGITVLDPSTENVATINPITTSGTVQRLGDVRPLVIRGNRLYYNIDNAVIGRVNLMTSSVEEIPTPAESSGQYRADYTGVYTVLSLGAPHATIDGNPFPASLGFNLAHLSDFSNSFVTIVDTLSQTNIPNSNTLVNMAVGMYDGEVHFSGEVYNLQIGSDAAYTTDIYKVLLHYPQP